MNETLKAAGNIGAELGAARAENEALREQVKALQSGANSWQSGYDKGRHDGARHRKSEVEQLRQHKNEYMDAAEVTRKALLAEIDSLRNGLKNARYRIEQGRVWNGMGWTLTGLHAHQQQKALDEIDAALSRQAEPAPAQGEQQPAYVECRECTDCGHVGINDAHPTDATCAMCDWSGPSPVEDQCPDCGKENAMGAACPKCSGRYRILAETHVAAPIAQTAPQPEQSGLDPHAIAQQVREALDRQACPNAWMTIAYEAAVTALSATPSPAQGGDA